MPPEFGGDTIVPLVGQPSAVIIQKLLLAFHTKKLIRVFLFEKGPVWLNNL